MGEGEGQGEPPDPPAGGLEVKAKGSFGGWLIHVFATGAPAAYVLLAFIVIGGFWKLDDPLPGYFVLSIVALFVLGLMLGYRMMGSHAERLERENRRLTGEVERVSREKSRLQGKILDDRKSSED